ncbi:MULTISPECIES: AMP-binding protein [Acetobacter]|uniref:Putative fatty-acid--CoA ligase FadD21 n=1 Tax=Acetobacter pomorum DM001 TaxID=945681 RepID=F1YV54_9PROT|nr:MULTISPECIES: AMP-binding protein [Acetobacter]ATI11979.1 fatty-acid--CoA ligase [Acetobacter pomorum]AXC25653.1 fatty-acid--CoA ligase [Acetobacter sp. JWB]EGE47159.1 Putative fatty-acid--CoA ligase FadD21 [Acetobacter pomorum DM001]KAA8422526.1 fatty acyl-AMP ligase [Acetobacter pomorum]KAA8431052.1 fatty acyl-AMP ligase [Acetobacter pomorum]
MEKFPSLVLGPNQEQIPDWRQISLAELCRFRTMVQPDLEIMSFLGDGIHETETLTIERLDRQASHMAAWLSKVLPPSSKVMLLFENGPDYLIGLFGCAYAGMVAVSGVYPSDFGSRDRLNYIVKDSECSAILGKKKVLEAFQSECLEVSQEVFWIPVEISETYYKKVYNPSLNEDLALIQYTSGSTQNPKGVILTNRNILFNLLQQGQKFGYQKGDVGVSWLPLSHDMGLMGAALMAIGAGGKCVLLPPETFLKDPSNWLRAISKYGATLSGGPAFAYQMCLNINEDTIDSLDLSTWDQAFVGSESINRKVLEQFEVKFSKYRFKNLAFCPCYGLAEATLLVSAKERNLLPLFITVSREKLSEGYIVETENLEDQRGIVSSGNLIDETQAVIVDSNMNICSDRECGTIYLNGPSISSGYCGRFSKNIESFNYEGKLYISTGDKGFFINQNIYIIGRKDNEINVNGVLLDPEDIVFSVNEVEDKLSQRNCAVFQKTGRHESIVFVFGAANLEESVFTSIFRNIKNILCRKFKVSNGEIIAVSKSGIVRTPSGKVSMKKTQQHLEDGRIDMVFRKEFSSHDNSSFHVRKMKTYERSSK